MALVFGRSDWCEATTACFDQIVYDKKEYEALLQEVNVLTQSMKALEIKVKELRKRD